MARIVPGVSITTILDRRMLTLTIRSRLIEHPVEIPEPKAVAAGPNLYFEDLALQPMQLELSFMRTDRVNVDEK